MKSISKNQQKQLDAHSVAVAAAYSVLETAVDDFNEKLSEEKEKLENAEAAYNEVVEAAEGFRAEVHSDMNDYFDERSEKWQEENDSYAQWMAAWAEELDKIDLDLPSDVDLDDGSVHDRIEEWPVEPE